MLRSTKALLLFLPLFLGVYTSHSHSWDLIQELEPTPEEVVVENAFYGRKVAIDGDYAVVINQEEGIKNRAIDVLHFNGTWKKVATLETPYKTIGLTYKILGVDISGETIAIGASSAFEIDNETGLVYVFTKPADGWKDMRPSYILTPPDDGDDMRFGWSVKVNGGDILVGAPNANGRVANSGAAYMYVQSNFDWEDNTPSAKFMSVNGAEGDNFGASIALEDDQLVIAATSYSNSNFSNVGAAYVFSKKDNQWRTSFETAMLTYSNAKMWLLAVPKEKALLFLGNQELNGRTCPKRRF